MKLDWAFKISGKNEEAIRFLIMENEVALSFNQVFDYWTESEGFVQFYTEQISALGFDAYFWEHPALKSSLLEHKYECIIRKSNAFPKRTINLTAFADHIHSDNLIAVFDNLGKNAKLVVPTIKAETSTYKHLASFFKEAPREQSQALFQNIGKTMKTELSLNKLIWLNTAGMGVIWLHVRLDTKPKYYKSKTYKNPSFLL